MDNIFAAFPEIETERLLLREILPEDTGAIYRLFSNENVTRFHDLDTYTDPRQAEELIDFFDESFELERAIFWGITCQEDGALIGTCAYVWLRTHRGEISYNLHPDYWKQGYMQEALDAIVDFGFAELGLNRVEALVMLENAASARVLRGLGFQEEGILRQHDYFKGQFHDMRLFALLSQDYYAE